MGEYSKYVKQARQAKQASKLGKTALETAMCNAMNMVDPRVDHSKRPKRDKCAQMHVYMNRMPMHGVMQREMQDVMPMQNAMQRCHLDSALAGELFTCPSALLQSCHPDSADEVTDVHNTIQKNK